MDLCQRVIKTHLHLAPENTVKTFLYLLLSQTTFCLVVAGKAQVLLTTLMMLYSIQVLVRRDFTNKSPGTSSIHPFSSTYPGPGHGGSRLSKVVQTPLSTATFSSLSWGIPRPSQARWYNPFSMFWVYHVVSCQLDVPKKPPGGMPGRHPDQMLKPPQLALLWAP